jgi:hypothetical protein
MPCRSEYMEDDSSKRINELESMLCAVLTAAEATTGMLDDLLEGVDWQEAGVTPETLRGWWDRHRAKDQERLRREALAKLTPAEKRALNL